MKPHPDVIKRFGFVKTRDRKCRNCFCLALFLLSWLAYIIIGSLGIHYGRPEAFVYGTDYQGNLCGTESLEQAKYIVYPRTNQDFLWNINTKNPLEYKFFGICTPHCPGLRGDIDFVCDYTIHRPTQPLPFSRPFILDCLARQDQVAQCRTIRKHCYHVPVPTKPILNRCIPAYEFNYTKTKSCLFPTQINDAADPDCLVIKSTVTTTSEEPSTPVLLFDQLNQLYFSTGRYITDIVRSWWVIALSAILVPALLSALWLAAMKRFTHAVIIAAILTLLTIGILLTLFIFAQAGTIQYDWIAQYNLEQYAFLSDESTLYLAYGMTAVMLIVLLVLFSLRKSIARSIHVLKLGSKALRKLPMALVFPINVVLSILSLFVWAAYVAASLASAGETVVVDVRQELAAMRLQANTTIS
jgi:choline transporter-like protein 2/4/5